MKIFWVMTALLAFSGLAEADTLISPGATWRYLDNGSNQGTAWRSPAFNDSAWSIGPAQLGYGDGDEATVVSFGPNSSAKYTTTYFRRAFNVVNPAAYLGLTLRARRDDGIVVYVNGTEAWRDTMPAGAVSYTTLATVAVSDDGATWLQTSISPALLVAGNNVIAVEIHQSAGTSSDISFDLELIGTASATVTRGPYLQVGTPTSLIVRWRTGAATDSRVQFGLNTSYGNTVLDPSSTTEHSVSLSGLTPDTRYYYAVGSSSGNLAGDASYTFKTAPLPGTPQSARIWVLGDAGTKNSSQIAVRDAYLSYTGTTPTNLWLMLGDNAYDTGTDADFQAAVFDMYPTTLRQSVLWPTIGNHDTAQSSNPPASLPYFQMFTLPAAAEAGGLASGTEKYYSFNYNNIHFVCLDSMTSNRAAGSPMLTWLQNDLAANTKDWLVAFWHHPPYSKGSHNSDTDPILTEMRANVLPILESYGVDLILAGHSHSYERSYLLDGHYGLSATLTAAMIKDAGSGRADGTGAYQKPVLGPSAHGGAVYAVAGSSGQIAGGTLNHPAMFVSLNNLGSVVLDINGGTLDARFLRENGTVADYFTIVKQSVANVPPTASITSPANGAAFVAPAAISIKANAADTDGTVQKVDFYRGSTLLGTDTTAPYSFDWINVSPGGYSLTVKATDNSGAVTTSTAVAVTVTGISTTFVPTGSIWKYLDNGSNQGTAWRATAFNDTAWKSGAGQLGYGDGDEATVVSYGNRSSQKYITTYFRKAFTVANRAAVSGLQLRLMRDDGAVVYLNGTEVYRTNMPGGAINSSTLASTDITGSAESAFLKTTIGTAPLVTGTNVIAVEIHQRSRSSSDISFELELAAIP